MSTKLFFGGDANNNMVSPCDDDDNYGISSGSSSSDDAEEDEDESITEESYDSSSSSSSPSNSEYSKSDDDDDDDDDDNDYGVSVGGVNTNDYLRISFASYVRIIFVDAFLRFKDGYGAAPYRRSLDIEEARFRTKLKTAIRDEDDDDDYVDDDAETPLEVIVCDHTRSIENLLRAATYEHSDRRVEIVAEALKNSPSPKLTKFTVSADKRLLCALTGTPLSAGMRGLHLNDQLYFDESVLNIFNAIALLVNFEAITRCTLLEYFDNACMSTAKRARTSLRTSASPLMSITSALQLVENPVSGKSVIDGLFGQFTNALTLLGASEVDEDDDVEMTNNEEKQ